MQRGWQFVAEGKEDQTLAKPGGNGESRFLQPSIVATERPVAAAAQIESRPQTNGSAGGSKTCRSPLPRHAWHGHTASALRFAQEPLRHFLVLRPNGSVRGTSLHRSSPDHLLIRPRPTAGSRAAAPPASTQPP